MCRPCFIFKCIPDANSRRRLLSHTFFVSSRKPTSGCSSAVDVKTLFPFVDSTQRAGEFLLPAINALFAEYRYLSKSRIDSSGGKIISRIKVTQLNNSFALCAHLNRKTARCASSFSDYRLNCGKKKKKQVLIHRIRTHSDVGIWRICFSSLRYARNSLCLHHTYFRPTHT